MRVPFTTCFREYPDGRLTVLEKVRCGGLTAMQEVNLGHSWYFGGIDWKLFKDHDLDVKTADDDKEIIILNGIY